MDLYNLSSTCKYYAKKIDKKDFNMRIIYEINKRLRNIFGDDYMEFKKTMHETGATIVGSFITQCVLDEDWKNSDIDIYVRSFESKLLLFFKNKKYTCNPRDGIYPVNIEQISIFRINGYKIKIMDVHSISIVDYVKNLCMYNICKIMYQCNDIDSNLNDSSINNLHVYNLSDIVNRCTNICMYNIEKYLYHFEKYYKRGFKFYLDDEKKKILTNEGIHDVLSQQMRIAVKRIIEQTKNRPDNLLNKFISFYDTIFLEQNEINLNDPECRFTVIDNEICSAKKCADTKRDTITRLYKVCNAKLPGGLYISRCCDMHNICITKLLFPNQKHLHGNLGVFILDEK